MVTDINQSYSLAKILFRNVDKYCNWKLKVEVEIKRYIILHIMVHIESPIITQLARPGVK